MELKHIEIENLKVSPVNVRKHGDKTGDDLVPSIKALGMIQPLLVRPTRGVEGDSPTGKQKQCEGFEVVAGQRRLNALQQIAKTDNINPVPCVVMNDHDDAKAIEASLTENIARLPMDEMNQYEAFLAMTRTGQTVSDIAAHFGVSERRVPNEIEDRSLTTLKEKLLMITAKVVHHGGYVIFQLAEAEVPGNLLGKILGLIDDLRRRPRQA